MKERYDLKAVPNPYKIGQRVWVYIPKTQKGLSKKLLHHRHGPFRIVKKIPPVNFKLRNSANRLAAAPVHVNRMKPFYDTNDRPIEPPNSISTDNFCLNEDEIPEDSFQVEPLVAPNEQNESEIATRIPEADSQDSDNVNDDSSVSKIEKMLKTRVKKGQKEYLVKWLGYPSEQNSWVPESDMVTPDSTLSPPINAMQFTSQRFLLSKPSTGLSGKPSWSKSCVSPLRSFFVICLLFCGITSFHLLFFV